MPREAAQGKIPSGKAELSLDLVPTVKVIDEVRGHDAVVANRDEETGPAPGAEPARLVGKPAIARALADCLERPVAPSPARSAPS